MESNFIPLQHFKPMETITGAREQQANAGETFGNFLAQALGNVNNTMGDAEEMGKKAATGELGNLHDLTITSAKSEVLLHLTTQVCSKVTSACTTMFQMQM